MKGKELYSPVSVKTDTENLGNFPHGSVPRKVIYTICGNRLRRLARLPVSRTSGFTTCGIRSQVHTQFIGEIIDVKADRNTLSEDGLPDILKIKPLVYDTAHKGYHAVGSLLGKAFSIGKQLL